MNTRNTKLSKQIILSIVVVIALASCASSSRDRPRTWVDATDLDPSDPAASHAFPPRAELEKLTAKPLPATRFKESIDAPRWELEGPFPDRLELRPHLYQDVWGKELARMIEAGQGGHFASADMACSAKEVGRFLLAHGGPPSTQLLSFIASSCGTSASLSTRFLTGEVSGKVNEKQLFERWGDQYREALKETMVDSKRPIGVWFGRSEGKAVLLIATSSPKVRLEPMSLVPGADGRVVVRGELLETTSHVRGLINRGDFGWSKCESDEEVELPAFVLRCEADPSDAIARLEISSTKPGRFLGSPVAGLLVYPQGAQQRTYEPARLPRFAAEAAEAAGDPVGEFLYRLNEVRQRASMSPVALAVEQSRIAEELAPYYFASVQGETEVAHSDLIALGLLAGWDVEGMVQSGGFNSASVVGGEPVSDLLALLLDSPYGRSTLLDPAIGQIAIGLLDPQEQGDESFLGGVITSYTIYDERQYDAELDGVLDRIAAIRKETDQPLSVWYEDLEPFAVEAARKIEAGAATPPQAMDWLMEQVVGVVGRSVQGYLVTASSLDDFKFPAALLEGPSYGLVAAIARYQPKGEPWGRYAVIFVSTARGGAAASTVASR